MCSNFYVFTCAPTAAVIAAVVLHYLICYRFIEGFEGFLGKVGSGWVGAWLGSPVLGHWFEPVKLTGIYLIPALLGAFAGAFALTATWKGRAKIGAPK